MATQFSAENARISVVVRARPPADGSNPDDAMSIFPDQQGLINIRLCPTHHSPTPRNGSRNLKLPQAGVGTGFEAASHHRFLCPYSFCSRDDTRFLCVWSPINRGADADGEPVEREFLLDDVLTPSTSQKVTCHLPSHSCLGQEGELARPTETTTSAAPPTYSHSPSPSPTPIPHPPVDPPTP